MSLATINYEQPARRFNLLDRVRFVVDGIELEGQINDYYPFLDQYGWWYVVVTAEEESFFLPQDKHLKPAKQQKKKAKKS